LSYRNHGKYLIEISAFFVILLLIFLGLSAQPVYGKEVWEMAYDDGTAEDYYFWAICKFGVDCGPVDKSGYMLAVQFDIPGEEVKVVGVRYYIGKPYRFKVRIFDSDRNPLPIDLEVTPSSSGWVSVDLSEYNLIVVDRFYVALEYIPGVGKSGFRLLTPDAGSRPMLGVDLTDPKGLSWAIDGRTGKWESSEEWTTRSGLKDGNFMIRATVQKISLYTVKVDSSPKISDIIVDGERIESKDLPMIFKWREGSTHTIEVAHQIKEIDEGTRYIFTEWSDGIKDPSRTITISEDLNLTALYKIQYLLSITSKYGRIEGGGWYDSGSRAEISIVDAVLDHGNRTRRIFMGWKGDIVSNKTAVSVLMDSPHNIVADWKTQYFLSLKSNIEEIEIPGKGGWRDRGEIVSLTTSPIIKIDKNSRYRCAGYIIDGAALVPEMEADVLMNEPHTFTWIYYQQFRLNVSSDYGDPEILGSFLGDLASNREWFDKDSMITIRLKPIIEHENLTRRVFLEWTGTVSGATPDLKFRLKKPSELHALWRTQYLVTFKFTNPKGKPLYLKTPIELVLINPEGEEVGRIDYSGAWMERGEYYIKRLSLRRTDVRIPEFSVIRITKPGAISIPTSIYSVTVRVSDLFNIPIQGALVKLSADGYEVIEYTNSEGIATLNTPREKYIIEVNYLGQSAELLGDASLRSFIEANVCFSLFSLILVVAGAVIAAIIGVIILRKRASKIGEGSTNMLKSREFPRSA